MRSAPVLHGIGTGKVCGEILCIHSPGTLKSFSMFDLTGSSSLSVLPTNSDTCCLVGILHLGLHLHRSKGFSLGCLDTLFTSWSKASGNRVCCIARSKRHFLYGLLIVQRDYTCGIMLQVIKWFSVKVGVWC